MVSTTITIVSKLPMTSWSNLICSYFRAPPNHLHIQQLTRKTHKGKHIPVLTDNIYDSDRVRFYKQIRGKDRYSWEESMLRFLIFSLSRRSQWEHTPSSGDGSATCVQLLCPEKAMRDAEFKGFIEGWSCRHSLPSQYQNSWFLIRKQMFTISTSYKPSQQSKTTSSENDSEAKFPDASKGPTLQVGFSQACDVISFLRTSPTTLHYLINPMPLSVSTLHFSYISICLLSICL